MNENEIESIAAGCKRFLGGHGRIDGRQVMLDLAMEIAEHERPDNYGRGALIADFECEIAGLLGHESAVMMPSGTMAQQIALRIWADRRSVRHVAFHPTCHLEIYEQKGYQLLHDLHAVLVGSPHTLITLEDLERVREPFSALLIELPQREIGGQLPTWEDLRAQVGWARDHGAAVHMDGARLWESAPFYERSYAEIAGLFDSVYVSLYKGLGGLAGAVLAGPADFVAEARIWQRRHGGNLVTLYPYVVSGRRCLRERLPRMADYHRKAVEIATAFGSLSEIEMTPDPPHAHMMHLYLQGEREDLVRAALEVARETGTWLFGSLDRTALPSHHKMELSVGDATMAIPTEEIAGLFEEVFRRASRAGPVVPVEPGPAG